MRKGFKHNEKLVLIALSVATLFLMTSCASRRHHKVKNEVVINVVEAARSFTGTPYKYGGTTRTGMDCSGLLINAFRTINISLPRSAEDQSKVGEEVQMKDLQPGDLVFFATGKKKKKITHVGLVTDVIDKDHVKFIHASSVLGVVETNLYAAYYQQHYITARRVIPQ